jgi:putative transposase
VKTSERVQLVLKWNCLGYGVKQLCQIICLSRANFYRCITISEITKQPVLKVFQRGRGYSYSYDGEKVPDDQIKSVLLEISRADGYNYGYRKLTYCLRKRHKLFINKKKVYRLCQEIKILKPCRHNRQRKPGKLARNRLVNGPNQLWQGDIKFGYIQGEDRNFYILSFVDVFDRVIVGYTVGRNCLGKHAGEALKQGLLRRQLYKRDSPLIVRTDNGPQFTGLQFTSVCDELTIEHERIPPKTPNMNAYIEAFHSVLEDDLMRFMEFESLQDVRDKLARYIKYYNQVRIHGSLGYLTPEEYHNQYKQGMLPPVEIRL